MLKPAAAQKSFFFQERLFFKKVFGLVKLAILSLSSVRDRTLSMHERGGGRPGLKGFCGGHEMFQAYNDGPEIFFKISDGPQNIFLFYFRNFYFQVKGVEQKISKLSMIKS